jgi:large subunit ribosomal protein L23
MQILKKPYLTPKSASHNKRNKYCFLVDKASNKIEIKKAVEKLYTVTVEKVNTMRRKPERITRYMKGSRVQGQKAAYKKAILTLAANQTIDVMAS